MVRGIFQLSGTAFRLAPSVGALLVLSDCKAICRTRRCFGSWPLSSLSSRPAFWLWSRMQWISMNMERGWTSRKLIARSTTAMTKSISGMVYPFPFPNFQSDPTSPNRSHTFFIRSFSHKIRSSYKICRKLAPHPRSTSRPTKSFSF